MALALVEEEEITPSHADLRAVERETAMQILSGIDRYFGQSHRRGEEAEAAAPASVFAVATTA